MTNLHTGDSSFMGGPSRLNPIFSGSEIHDSATQFAEGFPRNYGLPEKEPPCDP